MRLAPLALLAVVALPLMTAAAEVNADIVPVIVHPYPDDADPLGFPYSGGRDPFVTRHAWRFEGIPPYPYTVIDGRHVIPGIPNPEDPMQSTRDALTAALDARQAMPAPVGIHMESSQDGDTLTAHVTLHPAPGAPPTGRLWVGLTEDHVFFRPPQAVSNGITDHRFTLRALQELGTTPLDAHRTHNVSFALDAAWAVDQLAVVAWVEASAEDPRFDSREVLNAAHHTPGTPVQQDTRAVLVEMLSATWCPPCIYGDTALDELAGGEPAPDRDIDYFQGVPGYALFAALAGAVALAWRRP